MLGLCELDPEVHAGLVRHLADKLDELTLATLVVLLRRNPETRISHADLAFLRHAHTQHLHLHTQRLHLHTQHLHLHDQVPVVSSTEVLPSVPSIILTSTLHLFLPLCGDVNKCSPSRL